MNESLRHQARFSWLSTSQAAAELGDVSDQQVYEWIENGQLTAFDASREPGTTRPDWRFKPEWLADFAARRTKNADKAAA